MLCLAPRVGREPITLRLTGAGGAGRTRRVCAWWVHELSPVGWLVMSVAVRTAVIEPANGSARCARGAGAELGTAARCRRGPRCAVFATRLRSPPRRVACRYLLAEVHAPGPRLRGIGGGRIFVDVADTLSIGERTRKIRCRRGLSLEVAGGLAGISGPYPTLPTTPRTTMNSYPQQQYGYPQ